MTFAALDARLRARWPTASQFSRDAVEMRDHQPAEVTGFDPPDHASSSGRTRLGQRSGRRGGRAAPRDVHVATSATGSYKGSERSVTNAPRIWIHPQGD